MRLVLLELVATERRDARLDSTGSQRNKTQTSDRQNPEGEHVRLGITFCSSALHVHVLSQEVDLFNEECRR